MINDNKLVKDYLGNLVPKSKAHKILGKYYVEDESCFRLEDGQMYRITSTDKIAYDHFKKKYVLKASNKLIEGIINSKGEIGLFSDNELYINLLESSRQRGAPGTSCLNEKIAESLGYIESISDGIFYKKINVRDEDLKAWFNKKSIPNSERSKSYNLESDLGRKKQLIDAYNEYNPKISVISKKIAKVIGEKTFGVECEIINGFLPKRIRFKLGIKALKDGSLRWEGGEGLEYVSMPMSGPKGIEVIREFCKELSKRCEVNNLCSVHFHFGNVRKDKLYILSLYKLVSLVQNELINYFPYSRFHSIKPDGKVYCKLLDNLNINYSKILSASNEETFHRETVEEFDKIYKWLNNGKGLAEEYGERQIVRETKIVNGKKMFFDKWLKNIYTTKSVYHAISGNKWDRPQRYFGVNFLNLFFSKMGTIEFRQMEGSTNSTKILNWMLVCACILNYAEDINKCFILEKITLKEILRKSLSENWTNYLMEYMDYRNRYFFDKGAYKDWKPTEDKWFKNDSDFSFKNINMEIK